MNLQEKKQMLTDNEISFPANATLAQINKLLIDNQLIEESNTIDCTTSKSGKELIQRNRAQDGIAVGETVKGKFTGDISEKEIPSLDKCVIEGLFQTPSGRQTVNVSGEVLKVNQEYTLVKISRATKSGSQWESYQFVN